MWLVELKTVCVCVYHHINNMFYTATVLQIFMVLLCSSENSGPENIPPVGVFWDIENCSVPSGRSAEAVVQHIRNRFFQGHREAEFICVCDISKENKAVIQELNNCQVSALLDYFSSVHAGS